ncbi:MAG TPA: ABC transporter permease [Thermoguttaceae bacterium]|nr:ABC transporter permease [Thermoguttaceae bacterium]
MYKLLLCWRYLRTRYIALASIMSVMLGVATMIVVNSVMAGFTHEMQDRIHGILSDVTIECHSLEGMPDLNDLEFFPPEGDRRRTVRERIERTVGDRIEGMTATVIVPAMLSYQHGGRWVTRQVQVIGIDEKTQSQVSDFGKYLQHPENRQQMEFRLREGGYDTRDHQTGPDAPERVEMRNAGWAHRRAKFAGQQLMPTGLQSSGPSENFRPDPFQRHQQMAARQEGPALAPAAAQTGPNENPADWFPPTDPFAARTPSSQFDPTRQTQPGTAVLGIALASFRTPEGEERFLALPGDDVQLTIPTAGTPPKPISDTFTVVDFYESKMSEYDSSLVFVPIQRLQELRGMKGMVSSIQIKLKPGVDAAEVRDQLRLKFPAAYYGILTWRDKQGPLLAAVQMETAILNVLLFLIITVAGFGILAIFLMIVVEKTRDIGILKSLGASGQGVMGIFLAYGLSLGLIGSGVGLVLGLLFVGHINQIADLLGRITGQKFFDPSVYYFYEIPTVVDPLTVAWIVGGAITIAVLASVLPALRAALLHPVEALRYE